MHGHRRRLKPGQHNAQPPRAQAGDSLVGQAARKAQARLCGGDAHLVGVADSRQGLELWLPDYPGNLFFNTLGNLAQRPLAGLLWVDYDDGGLLHVAARAELLWGEAERAPWPGAQRVLRLLVLGGVWRAQALPWRWTAAQPAPQFNAMRQASGVQGRRPPT